MSAIAEVLEAMHGRPRWKVVTFAAGAAERAAPIFRFLARPGSVEEFEASLVLAWNAALGRPLPRGIPTALADLRALPEMGEAHVGYPMVAASWALGILETAVEAVESKDLDEMADRAAVRTVNLISNFDSLIEHPPEFIVAGPLGGGRPPPGPLKRGELRAQQAVVELLGNQELSIEQVVTQTRLLSHEQAAPLAEAMPRVAQRQGWNLQ